MRIPFSRPCHAIAACGAALLLLLPGCQNVPKYKRSSGKFPEWETYEGKHFSPSNGTVTAVDTTASTVTITQGTATRVLTVTPETRIIHEAADVPLSQLPLNQQVKISLSEDGKRLISIWYGHRLFTYPRRNQSRQKQQTAL